MFAIYIIGRKGCVVLSLHRTFKQAMVRWHKVYNKVAIDITECDNITPPWPCIRSGKTTKRYSCGELTRRI